MKIPFKFIIGVYIVLLGVGLLLNQTGLVDVGSIFGTWWPTYTLIVFGLLMLFSGSKNYVSAGILLLMGILFQLASLNIITWNIWDIIWPLIIICVGLGTIFSFSRRSKKTSADDINYFTAFGGVEKKLSSENFKGGNITALFGGVDIDLRDAHFDPEGAAIDVLALFGGSTIIVPKNVEVKSSGFPIMGAFSDKTKVEGEKKGMLEVKGFAAFGGVEIRNNPKED